MRRRDLETARIALKILDLPRSLVKLEAALSGVLGCRATIAVRCPGLAAPSPAAPGRLSLLLEGSLPVDLDPEPALVSELLARVLGQPHGIHRLEPAHDPGLEGAAGAIAVEVARRAGFAARWNGGQQPRSGEAIGADATVDIDGRAYSVRARTWPVTQPLGFTAREPTLVDLGTNEIELHLVAGASLADRGEMESLGHGDAWLPGSGWWISRDGHGRALLVAPDAESGVWVDLAADGRIVLTSDLGTVEADPDSTQGAIDLTESEDNVRGAIESAVLDAPVVVRVEIGAVSLPARQWAALKPGDVLETGRPLGQPVTLRIAGREVGRGDLVNVEGELGVRVRELFTGGQT